MIGNIFIKELKAMTVTVVCVQKTKESIIKSSGIAMPKRKLRYVWTCSDYCHKQHKWKWSAWLHGRWLKIKHSYAWKK